MKNENEVIGNLMFELEEVERVGILPEEDSPYSITVDYGAFLTLLCCP